LRYIMGSNAVKSYTKSKGGKQSFPKLLNKQYKVKIDEPTTKNQTILHPLYETENGL